MSQHFQTIGLFAKYQDPKVIESLNELVGFLRQRGHTLALEQDCANALKNSVLSDIPAVPRELIGAQSDLIIVLGGDGSLLNAARAVIAQDTPILGVNRGKLGFLADILPDEFSKKLTDILDGIYTLEHRTLLETRLLRDKQTIAQCNALNDCVLYTSDVARMIEFEIWINQKFVLKQRADGLIVATPTGSTAYALSGGGPILYPTLQAFTLVPMLPHMLTSRPIVIDDDSEVELFITPTNEVPLKLSLDGQVHLDLHKGDRVCIKKYTHKLPLIHPKGHNYYAVLRQKLGWGTHLTSDRYTPSDPEKSP